MSAPIDNKPPLYPKPPTEPIDDKRKRIQQMRKYSKTLTPEQIKAYMAVQKPKIEEKK